MSLFLIGHRAFFALAYYILLLKKKRMSSLFLRFCVLFFCFVCGVRVCVPVSTFPLALVIHNTDTNVRMETSKITLAGGKKNTLGDIIIYVRLLRK